MNRREIITQTLADCVARLDVVLGSWGFVFEHCGCHASHTGPYASGNFVRGFTRIGLSCRDMIDNIFYEHSFVTEHSSWLEIQRFTIGHNTLMNALGHLTDCNLIESDNLPDAIVARNGNDRVEALIHDLSKFIAPILQKPSDDFYAIIRCGQRSYTVDYKR